jgi:hypothetical protein
VGDWRVMPSRRIGTHLDFVHLSIPIYILGTGACKVLIKHLLNALIRAINQTLKTILLEMFILFKKSAMCVI